MNPIILICVVLAGIAIYAFLKTPQELKYNKVVLPQLSKDDCCKICTSKKIIRGKISGGERSAFFSSSEFKYSLSITAKPLANLDSICFDFCIDCGYVGGFSDISNIHESLKAHGKQELLNRLNI